MTRILSRSDVLALLDRAECLDILRDGFRTHIGEDIPGQRIRTDLPFPGTATALLPGLLPGIDAYTVKVNAKFPAARPALRGVICLHSGHDGELLALLDSATITAWRTGLAAALGTDVLAGTGSALGIIGAGAQADVVVMGLRKLRRLSTVVVYDIDPARAELFAGRHGGRVAGLPAEVARSADIVVLATWSRAALLTFADTHSGQQFTSVGVDEPGKQELARDLLTVSLLVVDDRRLAAATGVLAGATFADTPTLGEILRGVHPGRSDSGQRTVYSPVGLPWQDLALSWLAYQKAQQRNVGLQIDLLSADRSPPTR